MEPIKESVKVAELPQEMQLLVKQFEELFKEPTGLPPSRSMDHKIPLLQGTHPFRLRPYRYTPAQKG